MSFCLDFWHQDLIDWTVCTCIMQYIVSQQQSFSLERSMCPYRRRASPQERFPPIMFEFDRRNSSLDFWTPVSNLERQQQTIFTVMSFLYKYLFFNLFVLENWCVAGGRAVGCYVICKYLWCQVLSILWWIFNYAQNNSLLFICTAPTVTHQLSRTN